LAELHERRAKFDKLLHQLDDAADGGAEDVDEKEFIEQ
jgi:hypothetical protein